MSKVQAAPRSGNEQSKPDGFVGSKLLIGSGIVVAVAISFGSFWIMKRTDSGPEALTVTTVRPTETIRLAPQPEPKAKAAPTAQPVVQPPQGTMKRMEAIQGAFSKK
ncbi:MAG: hypothetical protein K2Y71_27920 [Xanthobacteraceae bacterium]|nr:hypothetical protein [Xanthobacteraceae bacterium]